MSLRVPINLASEPFQKTRRVVVASAAISVVLLGTLGLLIAISAMESGQAAQLRLTAGRLQARLGAVAAEQTRLEGVLREPANAEVLDRSAFLNSLIYAKAISWTRLFDDLEKVMPHNVRLLAIRPTATGQNQIRLEMTVGAESGEPVIQMMKQLESSSQFGAIQWQNRYPPSQSEPLTRYRIIVDYAQKL